jgi:hypothetical protein
LRGEGDDFVPGRIVMKEKVVVCLLLVVGWNCLGTHVWAQDIGWMQKGVRVWYLGAVGGITSSNAEEAHLLEAVDGVNVRVKRHSALTHWTSPLPVETGTYPLLGKGPCWIHPAVLQTLDSFVGDTWMGHEIGTVTRSAYTYDTFPYHLLPARALFDLRPQRQLVKLTLFIPDFSTGEAWFDAETGLLLYYYTSSGVTTRFFMLAEINYDFARQAAFAEDDGPHTGFRSFVSEQSLNFPSGGGSVIIQSLVETRYGTTVEMRVSTSLTASNYYVTRDENYCFFGDIPILRRMDANQAPNFPPDQWNPCGEYLWWWVPPAALARETINVLTAPMARTATQPYTFTATGNPTPPQTFFFTNLWFGNDGYMTVFSATDPPMLEVTRDDAIFQNLTRVDGPDYYRNTMGRAIPDDIRPTVDIKANGSDTPLTLFSGQGLSITISLDNKNRNGTADWWLAASTPFGLYFYTFSGWTANLQPAYQGPLFSLNPFEVLNLPGSTLPPGTYAFYFGVDTEMDGNLTMGNAYYDSVQVNVAQ